MLGNQSQKSGQIKELHIVIVAQPTDYGKDVVLVQGDGLTIPVDDNDTFQITI